MIVIGINRASSNTTRTFDDDGTAGWTADHGDTVYGVDIDSSGNVYTGGNRTSDLTTRKYNNAGSLQWSVDHGANVLAITADSSGNVYTGGVRTSNLTTRKYNSAGSLQWSVDHGAAVLAVAVDSSGNVYTGGSRTGNLTTRKYNSSGSLQWSVDHGAAINGIAVDGSGNVYTVGTRASNLTTRKYDSAGNLVWSVDHGATNVYAVAVDASGNVYTGGGAATAESLTVRKYDSDGSLVWSASEESTTRAVAVDASGNVYTGGGPASFYDLNKYNSAGSLQWSKAQSAIIYGLAHQVLAQTTTIPALALSISLGIPYATAFHAVPALALPLALAVPSSLTPDPPDLQHLAVTETAIYTGVVTGVGDMLFLPLSAIECRRELGQSTWLIVRTTYTSALYAALPARIGAELIVFAGILGGTSSGIFLRSVLTDVAYTRAPQGGELRLTGRVQTPSYTATTRALTGLQSLQTVDGRRTVRCDVDPLLRPNDTATWDGDSWTVGIIQYEITPQNAWMRVTEDV